MPNPQYQATLEFYRNNIHELKKKFDEQCDSISAKAQENLSKVDENDKQATRAILEKEKEALALAVNEFETAIHKNNMEARQTLEAIDANEEGAADEGLNRELINI